jgi:hypothetical protein
MLISCLLIVSCQVGDDTPPGTLDEPVQERLIEYNSLTRSVDFNTPGDDVFTGKATVFDLRFYTGLQIEELSSTPIDELSPMDIQQIMRDNFDNAIQIQGETEPKIAGTAQSIVFTRVEPFGVLRYFLSLNVRDEVGNNSGPSNVVEASTALLTTVFEDVSEGSCFGASVSSGNLIEEDNDDNDNLDEADDIIIGDPCEDTVYVFKGSKSLGSSDANSDGIYELPSPDTADITVIGITGTMFGAQVAVERDIGGGNLDEIVVSSPGTNSNTGQVIVIFDNNNETYPALIDLNTGFTPDIVINGDSQGDNFGLEMITARGIVSGADDSILVGAPTALSNTGRAYLFKRSFLENNSNLTASQATAIFTGESSGDNFGSDITSAGIINNDNRTDIAITSPGAAKAYVIFGDNDIDDIDLSVDTSEVVTISGNLEDEFAFSITGNGDLDGDPDEDNRNDNRDDVVIGAPGFNLDTGKVFVYSGFDISDTFSDGVPLTTSHEITGVMPGGRFGEAMTYLGDFNPQAEIKDRFGGNVLFLDERTDDDVAISATGIDNGLVYVFLGNMNLPFALTADESEIKINGSDGSSGFGNVLENLNDINSDDQNDFAIGEDTKINAVY